MLEGMMTNFLCRCSRLEHLMLDCATSVDMIRAFDLKGDRLAQEVARHNQNAMDYGHLKFWWMRALPLLNEHGVPK